MQRVNSQKDQYPGDFFRDPADESGFRGRVNGERFQTFLYERLGQQPVYVTDASGTPVLDGNGNKVVVPRYGGREDGNAEDFAVLTTIFREDPQSLKDADPVIYQRFVDYYGGYDPLK